MSHPANNREPGLQQMFYCEWVAESTMRENLTRYYADKVICDFRIRCEQTIFDVHRIVLASQSEYFHDLFIKDRVKEEVDLSDYGIDVVIKCVSYFYHGKIIFEDHQALNLSKLAKFLGLKTLYGKCEKVHLISTDITPLNSIPVWRRASETDIDDKILAEKAFGVAIENFSQILNNAPEQIKKLTFSQAHEYIFDPKLSAQAPSERWKAAKLWLDCNKPFDPKRLQLFLQGMKKCNAKYYDIRQWTNEYDGYITEELMHQILYAPREDVYESKWQELVDRPELRATRVVRPQTLRRSAPDFLLGQGDIQPPSTPPGRVRTSLPARQPAHVTRSSDDPAWAGTHPAHIADSAADDIPLYGDYIFMTGIQYREGQEFKAPDNRVEIWPVCDMKKRRRRLTEIPVKMNPRGLVAICVINDQLVVSGLGDDLRETHVYHTTRRAWRAGGVLPSPREGQAMVATRGRVHMFGGHLPGRKELDITVLAYDDGIDRWFPVGEITGRYSCNTCCVTHEDQSVFVYGPGDSYGNRKLLRYCPTSQSIKQEMKMVTSYEDPVYGMLVAQNCVILFENEGVFVYNTNSEIGVVRSLVYKLDYDYPAILLKPGGKRIFTIGGFPSYKSKRPGLQFLADVNSLIKDEGIGWNEEASEDLTNTWKICASAYCVGTIQGQ